MVTLQGAKFVPHKVDFFAFCIGGPCLFPGNVELVPKIKISTADTSETTVDVGNLSFFRATEIDPNWTDVQR